MQIGDKIRITMLPAKAGDCILIEFLQEDYRILIDGGYVDTYDNYLRDKLLRLSKEGKRIQLLIITHIDADHIGGIQAFLKENGSAAKPNIIKVYEVWYNSFFHIYGEPECTGSLPDYVRLMLQGKALQGMRDCKNGSKDISVTQGNTVAKLLSVNGYRWNSSFEGKAVCVENRESILLHDRIACRLLGPGGEELHKLTQYWIRDMKRNVRNFKIYEDELYNAAFEGMFLHDGTAEPERNTGNISYWAGKNRWDIQNYAAGWNHKIDTSITNRSSIAFLLQYEAITMLFPGDCPVQVFQEKLPGQIEVVKLPHHGSYANISRKFIQETQVTYYLLSTNGEKYDHPSPCVIGSILREAPTRAKIVKNYEIEALKTIGETEGDSYE